MRAVMGPGSSGGQGVPCDRRQWGFTTLELIVVLALGGLLLTLALASYQGAIRERRVVRVAEDLAGLLRFAQQSAVADSVNACRYEVVVQTNSASVQRVPRDTSGTCLPPDPPARVSDQYPAGVLVTAATVQFANTGGLVSGSAVSIGVTYGSRARYVRVEPATGRVEVSSTP